MSVPLDNLRSPVALARFVLTTILGLALDQITKVIAFDKLGDWPNGYPFIPGWLTFRATINHGAVFGIGQGQRPLFIAISILAIVFIGYLFLTSGRQAFYQIILGMLLAGVLGNMYDRVVYGYVRDMIYALPGKTIFGREIFPWIFNVADSLLCVGVGLIILGLYRTGQSVKQSPAPSGARD